MATTPWLDEFPLWSVALATALALLLADEIGFRLGSLYRHTTSEDEQKSQVGGIMAALLGLLAFMLAFTFGMAASRYADRKQNIVAEANAIGTTYLRTEFLSDTRGKTSRDLLRQYVNLRLEGAQVESPQELNQSLTSAEQVQDRLWSEAVWEANQHPDSEMVALYVESLNEVIDMHTIRVAKALRNRIPNTIWLTLYLISLVSMFVMGYHAGQLGTRSLMAKLALFFTFSAVILLIVDLDRPHQDLFGINQQTMIDLKNSFDRGGK